MANSIEEFHYEIFRQQTPKARWQLHDIAQKREDAIELANGLVAKKQAISARVVKQAYDTKTADFLSLKIFETGLQSHATSAKAEDLPPTQRCEKPQDFYDRPARAIIARLIGDYLARQRVTVTEFLHRADVLQHFERTQSVFQHAVQRLAVVRSASSDEDVLTIIKHLNTLVTGSLQRVYHDSEQGVFPELDANGLAELAGRCAASDDGSYILNGALALYLKPATSWDGKLARIFTVLEKAPAADPARTFLRSAIDTILEEVMTGGGSLYELIGGRDNLSIVLQTLLDLYFGDEKIVNGDLPGVAELGRRFAADDLPLARAALVNRIIAELKSTKRLAPAAIADEMKAITRVAMRVSKIHHTYLDPEELIAVLTSRSRSLVTPQALAEFTGNVVTPEEKLDRLLQVQENVIGLANKRELANAIQTLISSSAFESHFMAARPSAAAALQRLAEHQARIQKSGLPAGYRNGLASTLDRVAVNVEKHTNYFKTIEGRTQDIVDKALFYLSLCKGKVTQGRLGTRAQKAALSHINQPDFINRYAAKLQRDPAEAGAELKRQLEGAGINPAEATLAA